MLNHLSLGVRDLLHAVALQVGGRDNRAPGLRPHDGEHYCAACLIEPYGYPIEVVITTPT